MKYLFVESVALQPHLETAGEIAISKIENGDTAVFSYLGCDLPWHEWKVPKIYEWIGFGLERRVKHFSSILGENGVSIQKPFDSKAEAKILDEAQNWADSFFGGVEDLKAYSYCGASLGLGVVSSLISFAKDSQVDLEKYRFEVRSLMIGAVLVYRRTIKLLHSHQPDAVVTFNGRFGICYPIVAAAAQQGCMVLRHERGCDFRHYEVFKSSIHDFDARAEQIRIAWLKRKPDSTLIASKFFYDRRRGKDQGWYSFTQGQKEGEYPAKLFGKKRFVYFSSSDDEFAAIVDKNLSGPFKDQISAVKFLATWAQSKNNIEFIIRVHPHMAKKSSDENERWLALASLGATIIKADESVDSYSLLDSADFTATYGSTIGIESIFWGVPSILIGPAMYRGLGAVLEPTTIGELEVALNQCASGKSVAQPRLSHPYGYYHGTYGIKFNKYWPASFSEGEFLGRQLNWRPRFISFLAEVRRRFMKVLNFARR